MTDTAAPIAPIGSRWRDPFDGYRVRVVAIGQDGWPIVRPDYGNARSAWPVNPAWFPKWERLA